VEILLVSQLAQSLMQLLIPEETMVMIRILVHIEHMAGVLADLQTHPQMMQPMEQEIK
jgi:hypothetical protein